MERDRNLLFGVFAVQLKQITASQLAEAAAAWATDPSRALASRLVESGAISEDDRKLIDSFVDKAVEAHSGDVAATIHSFGGEDQIRESFRDSIAISDTGEVTLAAAGKVPEEFLDADRVPGVQESKGRYTRESPFSRGGMGRILLVYDEHLDRDIALKELLPASDSGSSKGDENESPVRQSAKILARFLQEARITGKLEHPSIVPVYELGHRQNGTLYYSMKLVRGQPLSLAIKNAETLEARLKLLPNFVDLCLAIAYAHSRGVIHRDVKPDNVMVGEFGETVVIDWGLAKSSGLKDVHAEGMKESLGQLTVGGAVDSVYGDAMGTPAYMSPEQARGALDEIDERSDVYSLGATLYEILTGETVFTGSTPAQIIKKVLAEEPLPATSVEREIPPELEAICRKALSKRASERYQTAKELGDEVRNFESGGKVGAYTYHVKENLIRVFRNLSFSFELKRSVRETNLQLADANLRLLERNRQLNQALDRESANKVASYRTSMILAQHHLDSHNPGQARETLTDAPKDERGWEWGYLHGRLDSSLIVAGGHGSDVTCAAYSPDGKELVSASRDYTVRIWDAETGRQLASLEGHGDEVLSVCFDAAGSKLLSASADGSARIWDRATLETLVVFEDSGQAMCQARFDTDGRRVVTASLDGDARIWIADSGEMETLLPGDGGELRGAEFSPDGSEVVTANTDGTASVWNLGRFERILTLKGHRDWIWNATYSPNGRQILTASLDKTARVWNRASGEESLVLEGHTDRVYSAQYSPDGKWIVTASFDNTARIWDALSGREIRSLEGHEAGVLYAAWSPSGERVVTASRDRTLRVWSAAEPAGEAVLPVSEARAEASCFSDDGFRVLSCGTGGGARVWDAENGKMLFELAADGDKLSSARFSHDGQRIITAGADGSVKIWSGQDGSEVAQLIGVDGGARFGQFSPDGRRVIVTMGDGSVSIWDLESKERTFTFPNETIALESPSVAADGRTIKTLSKSGKVETHTALPPDDEAWIKEFEQGAYLATVQRLPLRADTVTLRGSLGELSTWLREAIEELEDAAGDLRSRALQPGPKGGLMVHAPERLQSLAKLELTAGDIIYEIDGQSIGSIAGAQDALRNALEAIGSDDGAERPVEFQIAGPTSRRSLTVVLKLSER